MLGNTTLNTATVAYYSGTTPGSRACFVCDESSGYAPNTTISIERACQNDGRWSRTPVVCGVLQSFGMYHIQNLEPCQVYEAQGCDFPIHVIHTVAIRIVSCFSNKTP